MDGSELAAELRADLAWAAAELRARGVVPKMATVLVGEDPASLSYVGRKHADCVEVGIETQDIRLPAETSEAVLMAEIDRLNADPAVHGFMVQLPLPEGLDGDAALAAVSPAKDIDGLHPENLGRLLAGHPGLLPCTPAGVLALLRAHEVPLAGRDVAIVGRGPLVGRPLAMLLSLKGIDANVTLLHSASGDIAARLQQADVIVAALGLPRFVTPEMVKPGAAVVGVGITYEGDKVMSDVDPAVENVAGWTTPPQGSVGPLTRAMLLKNLLIAAGASFDA